MRRPYRRTAGARDPAGPRSGSRRSELAGAQQRHQLRRQRRGELSHVSFGQVVAVAIHDSAILLHGACDPPSWRGPKTLNPDGPKMDRGPDTGCTPRTWMRGGLGPILLREGATGRVAQSAR